MDRVEQLRTQAAALLTQADKIEAQPRDVYELGDIITWNANYRVGGRMYRWAAIKIYPDKWATTGRYGETPISWNDLWEKHLAGATEVWYATEWRELVQ